MGLRERKHAATLVSRTATSDNLQNGAWDTTVFTWSFISSAQREWIGRV